jgi:RNA polymerase sigma factor (sigma-70 family)
VNDLSDQQLLRDYLEHRSEAAFGELVRRHIDLVYSAAARLMRDQHLAEDVTQAVFVALAKNAAQLTGHPVLSGWLHCTARNLAANTIRANVRRQAREEEAAFMSKLLSTASDPLWEQIAPHLDAALGELGEADRDALLLRYFERKSAREMAQILNTSEEAAQKRVNRAVERLREFFSKRGVAIGASALVLLVSANAVQSAPLALAATISTAAFLTATTVHTSTVIAATKIIAMTTLQKNAVTVTLTAAIATGIFQAHQASQLRVQIQTLQREKISLAAQLQQLQEQQNGMNSMASSLRVENEHLKSNTIELAKLRSEIARLHSSDQDTANAPRTNQSASDHPETPDPTVADIQLPKNSWTNAGFATPEDNLRTRGWAVLNGDRERFKESVFLTDGARKLIEDMIIKMGAASTDPDKTAAMQAVVNNNWGAEEAILMPLMALNKDKGFIGYDIISEQSPSDDERILEVETQMASAPAHKEVLKFRRFGNDWKAVIDENFVKSAQ